MALIFTHIRDWDNNSLWHIFPGLQITDLERLIAKLRPGEGRPALQPPTPELVLQGPIRRNRNDDSENQAAPHEMTLKVTGKTFPELKDRQIVVTGMKMKIFSQTEVIQVDAYKDGGRLNKLDAPMMFNVKTGKGADEIIRSIFNLEGPKGPRKDPGRIDGAMALPLLPAKELRNAAGKTPEAKPNER